MFEESFELCFLVATLDLHLMAKVDVMSSSQFIVELSSESISVLGGYHEAGMNHDIYVDWYWSWYQTTDHTSAN
jgi:hypothetical protein